MNAKRKSKREVRIDETGIIKRGKYIFLIILALVTMLFPALEMPVENIIQSVKAE